MWKILLVDDNPADRVVYRQWLQCDPHTEYLIQEADSGRTGLMACETFQPDCILLDYRLRDLDGLQFLTHLAEQRRVQAPAVVMLTGAGHEEVAIEAMKRGARDYLNKDLLTTKALARAVAHAIEKVALQRALDVQRQQTSENEAHLRLALAAATMGTWKWNSATGEIHFSPEAEALWGLAPGTFPGTFDAFLTTLHPDDRVIFHSPWKIKGEGVTGDLEYRIVLPDGAVRWVAVRGQLLSDSGEKRKWAHGVVMDITARKQAEEEVRRLHNELERRVEERTVELAATVTALRAESEERKRGEAALRWYVDRQAQRSGLAIHFTTEGLESRLSPVLETTCFRLTQEALTNVLRHAHARHVWVEGRHDYNEVYLCIRDDGVGFDVRAVRERASQGKSLGILGMEERVRLVGGHLTLTSAPARGTEICARFPLMPRIGAPEAGQ